MGKYDQIIFIDTEVSASTGKVMDYGAVSNAFYDLKDSFRSVLEVLLGEREEFSAFFSLIKERNGVIRKTDISMRIQDILQEKIENATGNPCRRMQFVRRCAGNR